MKPAAIQAQLVDMRNVGAHKSLKLTLHVPEEHALAAIEAFGWPTGANPVPVALARLQLGKEAMLAEDNNARPAPRPVPGTDAPGQAKERRPFTTLPLPQQAALLCADPVFRTFLREEHGRHCADKDEAADALRILCGVASRAEIQTNTKAGETFVCNRERFLAWKMVDA